MISRHRQYIGLTITAALLLLLAPHDCRANANNYALPRVLNVGLLRLPSSGQSGSGPAAGTLLAPYIFDILSHRTDVMPSLWALQNPLAPATVTSVDARFGNVYSTFPNQNLTPNMAPYWEVDLGQINTADQLRPFNLLVVRTNGSIVLSLAQRQILRQYVDQGGTLWIDGSAGTTFDPSNSTNLTNPQLFNDTNLFRVNFNTTAPAATPSSHPLANSPYTLSSTLMGELGYGVGNSYGIISEVGGGSPDPTLFQPVSGSIVAGDYGAGHIIIDGLGICDAINAEQGSTPLTTWSTSNTYMSNSGFDETNYALSPTIDLQFLVNVLSYATSSATSGANVRGSGTQGGNLEGALTANWVYGLSPAAGDSAVGVATFGDYVYTSDTAGNLTCFDADTAVTASSSTSYTEFWTTQPGTGGGGSVSDLSPPVVALLPVSGVNAAVVMVQDHNGTVYGYQAGIAAETPLFTLGGSGSGSYGGNPPGPTYYRGQLLSPQPGTGGTVYVYNTEGGSAFPVSGGPSSVTSPTYTYNLNSGTGAWSQAALVASVPSDDGTYDGDEIVAYTVGQLGVNTLELGSRDEHLDFLQSAAGSAQYTSHASAELTGNNNLAGAFEDTNGSDTDADWILDFGGDNGGNVFSVPASSGTEPPGAIGLAPTDESIYADYDIVPGGIPGNNTVPVRTYIPAELVDTASNANTVAGAAVGADNLLYMTVNEATSGTAPNCGYIESVFEQAPSNAKSSILWRFALVTLSGDDASGIAYNFGGYTFVGAPVVGNNGLVYALATNGTNTDLLAFNTNPSIGFTSPFDSYTVQQTDEFQVTSVIQGSQYNGGHIVNFSPSNANPLQASLFVPGGLLVTPIDPQTKSATGPPVPVGMNTTWNGALPLLEWYTQLPVTSPSPMRLVGNYLYFGGENTTTVAGTTSTRAVNVAVLANPAGIGLQPDPQSRAIAYTADYRFVQQFPSLLNAITVPPVGTDRFLIVGGAQASTSGGSTSLFEGLSYSQVLVADSNRLVALDPAGNATWSLDSTQQSTFTSAQTATGFVSPGSATSVPLNRPSAVTQLSNNDYLIADTGNNRVVQVDHTGTVLSQVVDPFGYILIDQLEDSNGNLLPTTASSTPYSQEFSTFNDPLHLLPVGQPLTLNQPNSAVTWLTYEYASGAASPEAIDAHYLISDTGNSRILDIVDRYTAVKGSTNEFALEQTYGSGPTATGVSPDYHYLNWISHTSDVGGRLYKYVSAEPILDTVQANAPAMTYPDGASAPATVVNAATAIIGCVGDKRIAALATAVSSTGSTLSPLNQDAAGSSILLFYYSNGLASSASPATGMPYDLINAVAYSSSAATFNYLPLRGLRSVIATTFTPGNPTTTASGQFGSFVIADADGVFEGTRTTASTTNIPTSTNYPYVLDATYGTTSVGWSFLPTDYANVVYYYDSTYNTQDFATNLTFAPNSAVPLLGNNFLITNQGSAGNPNGPATNAADLGYGGDAFIVHAALSGSAAAVNTLDGPIYGRPANTGALDAPAFALRSN